MQKIIHTVRRRGLWLGLVALGALVAWPTAAEARWRYLRQGATFTKGRKYRKVRVRNCERVRVLSRRAVRGWVKVRRGSRNVGFVPARSLTNSRRAACRTLRRRGRTTVTRIRGKRHAKRKAATKRPTTESTTATTTATAESYPQSIQSTKSGQNPRTKHDYSDYYQVPAAKGHIFVRRHRDQTADTRMVWGRKPTVELILAVSQAWSKRHPGNPFALGDISAEGGGMVWKHASHSEGLDFDIHLVRKDGKPVSISHALRYTNLVHIAQRNYAENRPLIVELIQLFVDTAKKRGIVLDRIFFNDKEANKQITGVRINTDREAGNSRSNIHDEHFHIRLDKTKYLSKR